MTCSVRREGDKWVVATDDGMNDHHIDDLAIASRMELLGVDAENAIAAIMQEMVAGPGAHIYRDLIPAYTLAMQAEYRAQHPELFAPYVPEPDPQGPVETDDPPAPKVSTARVAPLALAEQDEDNGKAELTARRAQALAALGLADQSPDDPEPSTAQTLSLSRTTDTIETAPPLRGLAAVQVDALPVEAAALSDGWPALVAALDVDELAEYCAAFRQSMKTA